MMMMMDSARILEFLKGKSILITGSTGFLAKIFVEKLLRVQPEVKRLFLLIRAADAISTAGQRLQNEILDKDLFRILKEKHGDGFQAFAASKLCAVAGDITHENLGIQDPDLREKLCNEVQIVVNVAATTNFYDRYDVSLRINVLGAKHVLEFAKRCRRLEMLLHVSTAYVVGEQSGLILEKRFGMGETLRGGSSHHLDIEAEIELAERRKMELQADPNVTEAAQKLAMKELGLKRAKLFGWPNTYVFTKAMGEMVLGDLRPAELPLVILRPTIILSTLREPLPGWIEGTRSVDSLIIGYAKGKLPCLFGDLDLISDVIPGDMVVNAMAAAMAAHATEGGEFIYHVGSSVRNPVAFSMIEQCGYRYFQENPRVTKSGKTMKTTRMPVFRNMFLFRAFMALRYKLPLELMHLVSLLSGGTIFASEYKKLNRIYTFGMHLVDLYEPYVFFKGRFDDKNLDELRRSMASGDDGAGEVNMFAAGISTAMAPERGVVAGVVGRGPPVDPPEAPEAPGAPPETGALPAGPEGPGAGAEPVGAGAPSSSVALSVGSAPVGASEPEGSAPVGSTPVGASEPSGASVGVPTSVPLDSVSWAMTPAAKRREARMSWNFIFD